MNHFEKLPRAQEIVDSESEDSHDQTEIPTLLQQQAAYRFFSLKSTLSTETLESYAATRIAAAYRGHRARNLFLSLKVIISTVNILKTNIKLLNKELNEDILKTKLYHIQLGMSLNDWRAYSATQIQKIFRGYNIRAEIKSIGSRHNWLKLIAPISRFTRHIFGRHVIRCKKN